MCEEAEVPFVCNDKYPTDPSVIEALNNNPYFAGAVGPDNPVYGKTTAQYCIDQGWMTCIITAPNVGDPTDQPRLEAFTEEYEALGGEVLTVLNGDNADAQTRVDDALVAYGEVDVIYGTGSDFAIAAVQSLKKYPDWNTAIVTAGLDQTVIDLLAEEGSPMKMTMGDFWVSGQYSAMILEHYLNGEPLKDAEGNAIFITDVPYFPVSSDQVQAFKDTFIRQNCYSDEEILDMVAADYDGFLEAVYAFSFEDRAAAQGVTLP